MLQPGPEKSGLFFSTMQGLEKTILLVGASPRKGGNSDLLLKAASEGIQAQQVPCETVYLRDYIYQPCLGCEKCRTDKVCSRLRDGMTLLYPKVEAARGLLLASPVHHYNVTGWMKAFIDRLYCYYDFEDTQPRSWSSRVLPVRTEKGLSLASASRRIKRIWALLLRQCSCPWRHSGTRLSAPRESMVSLPEELSVKNPGQWMKRMRWEGNWLTLCAYRQYEGVPGKLFD